MDKIVALNRELELVLEGQVGNGASVEIKSQDWGRVGDNGLEINGVNKGFGESSRL